MPAMAKKDKAKKVDRDGVRVLVRNRRAAHDYQIHETVEAGLVLVGSEVKSLRDAAASIKEGFVVFRAGEAWLVDTKINEYAWSNQFNHEPKRDRKLLLHKREIRRLAVKCQQRGYTVIPLSLYLKNGKMKAELGLVTGKRLFEKRESNKAADARREIDRALKANRR